MSRARGLAGPTPSTGGARYSEQIRGVLRPHVPPAALELVVADLVAVLVEAVNASHDQPRQIRHENFAAALGSVSEAWAR